MSKYYEAISAAHCRTYFGKYDKIFDEYRGDFLKKLELMKLRVQVNWEVKEERYALIDWMKMDTLTKGWTGQIALHDIFLPKEVETLVQDSMEKAKLIYREENSSLMETNKREQLERWTVATA